MRISMTGTSRRSEASLGFRCSVWFALAWGVLALAWAGGLWIPGLVAFVAMTTGHVYSYRTLDRTTNAAGWLLVALLVLALLYMAADLLTAFAGGQLPQGQFGMASQAITSFRLRTRRDLYGTLIHSMLLLYVAADVAYSPWLLVFLLGYALSVLAAFSTATLVDMPRLESKAAALNALPVLGWAGLGTLALAFILFYGLPRFGSNQMVAAAVTSLPVSPGARGQPVTPLFPLVSFTSSGPTLGPPHMDLAYRGRPSFETVMYVRSQVRSYWRALTFDKYDGQTWESTFTPSRQRRGTKGGFELPSGGGQGIEFVQSYSIVRAQSDALFTGYWAELVQYPDTFMLRSEDVLLARQPLAAGTTYTVLSRLPSSDVESLGRAFHGDARYTSLPPLSRRVRELAGQITTGAGTDYQKAAALEHHLKANYRYDLNIPSLPVDAEAVDTFLFDHQRGFCQQFATAMAVLGRAAGLPTRVVTGYLPGQYDSIAGAFAVRSADAHSWVEVHFEGNGWVPFDPTPEVGGNARDYASMAWLVGTWGGPSLTDLGGAIEPAATALGARFAGMAGLLETIAAAMLALLIVLGGGVLAKRLPLFRWTARLRLARTPRETVLRRYAALEERLARTGVPRRTPWETPAEHLARAGDRIPDASTDLKAAARGLTAAFYGGEPASPILMLLDSLRLRLQGRGP